MKKNPKKKKVLCLFLFFCFYFKCSETSRDSVGHFGLNSLTHSPQLPPSLSLLLSLKEAAFCDLQIEAGHVTPSALSITAWDRPPSRLKETAPCPHPGTTAPQRAPCTRPILFRSSRKGDAQESWEYAQQLSRSFSFVQPATKQAASYASSTLRLQNLYRDNDEMPTFSQPHTLLCGAPGDTRLQRSPPDETPLRSNPSRFKDKNRFIFSPQLISAVTRLPTGHAHEALIQVQKHEHLQHSRANSVSPAASTAFVSKLQLSS